MEDLEITDKGIYYFHKYVPTKKREWERYKEHVKISELIIKYKNGIASSNKLFTKELEEAIIFLSNRVFVGNVIEIALVAVPPSEVDKYSPIRESINNIVDRYEKGEITEFKYLKKLHNCSNLLIRNMDVESSKDNKSARVKFNHYRSIDFDEDLIADFDENVAFILLDDITTTGFTIEVCEEILIDNEIDEDNIYKLVIAETVGDYYG